MHLDEQKVREYFELNNVMSFMFYLVNYLVLK